MSHINAETMYVPLISPHIVSLLFNHTNNILRKTLSSAGVFPNHRVADFGSRDQWRDVVNTVKELD